MLHPMTAERPGFADPLELPCSARLENRFFKSAMSEQLADRAHDPGVGLATLYRTWAEGGVGLQVTGNVMVDRTALGEPKNVVLDDRSDLAAFARWAEAGNANGARIWMQLNHPGAQSPSFLSREPVAPSAVPLGGNIAKAFRTPRALRDQEIVALIERFARAAELAKDAGFSGVQIHGAHGYLVSQFLSPRRNLRTDDWGGSAEKRRRFVLEIYRAIRARVGGAFPVGIKLNSADFQRGGFSEDESMDVIDALGAVGIDLVEISGGNYESPVMAGAGVSESSRRREAYFLDYAEKARAKSRVPMVVTGGFRSGAAMRGALESGATDLIGMARPLAVCPDFPNRLLADPESTVTLGRPSTGSKFLNRMAICFAMSILVMTVLTLLKPMPSPIVFTSQTTIGLETSRGARTAGIVVVLATLALYALFSPLGVAR